MQDSAKDFLCLNCQVKKIKKLFILFGFLSGNGIIVPLLEIYVGTIRKYNIQMGEKNMYQKEELQEIKRVAEVFGDFLKNHPIVDLAYSEKFGYMLVHGADGRLDDEWIPMEVTSGRHLFDLLCDEIYADYLEAREDGFDADITEADQDAVIELIEKYAKQLPEYDITAADIFVEE